MTTRWVYRISDGAWMVRGAGDPALIHSQPNAYAYADVEGGCPDPRTERHDAVSPTKRRPARVEEVAAHDVELVGTRAQSSSRDKDILATLAVIVRGRNPVTWAAMTTQQKVDATLAEADAWKSIREFIDDKV